MFMDGGLDCILYLFIIDIINTLELELHDLVCFYLTWMVSFCQEIMLQRVMSQIAAVKKDMIILEKSEFSALLAENEVRMFDNRLK